VGWFAVFFTPLSSSLRIMPFCSRRGRDGAYLNLEASIDIDSGPQIDPSRGRLFRRAPPIPLRVVSISTFFPLSTPPSDMALLPRPMPRPFRLIESSSGQECGPSMPPHICSPLPKVGYSPSRDSSISFGRYVRLFGCVRF